jgi:hypothetical protein
MAPRRKWQGTALTCASASEGLRTFAPDPAGSDSGGGGLAAKAEARTNTGDPSALHLPATSDAHERGRGLRELRGSEGLEVYRR